MADDDDKGRKTNADRDHKPSHEARKGYAPRGAEGRPAASGPTPGLGTRATRQVADRSTEQSPQAAPTQKQDNRVAFPETNDREVNAHYQKTERMIGKDDPQHPDNAQKKAEGPRVSQSDYAKAFRRATDKSRSTQKSQGNDIG